MLSAKSRPRLHEDGLNFAEWLLVDATKAVARIRELLFPLTGQNAAYAFLKAIAPASDRGRVRTA
jgi:hypothetical protein